MDAYDDEMEIYKMGERVVGYFVMDPERPDDCYVGPDQTSAFLKKIMLEKHGERKGKVWDLTGFVELDENYCWMFFGEDKPGPVPVGKPIRGWRVVSPDGKEWIIAHSGKEASKLRRVMEKIWRPAHLVVVQVGWLQKYSDGSEEFKFSL